MNQLPIIIDNLHFSSRKQTLSGVIDASTFERLRDVFVQDAANVEAKNQVRYTLTGWLDAQNRAFLTLNLDASLLMQCQRCLTAVAVPISLKFTYLVTQQTETEMLESEAMEDDVDLIEMDTQMDVGLLIEDELLVALPIAPVHVQACAELKLSSGEKANPFAALKELKKS